MLNNIYFSQILLDNQNLKSDFVVVVKLKIKLIMINNYQI